MVGQGVGVGDMPVQRGSQCRQRLFVNAEHQFLRGGRGANFIQENFEARIRDELEAERRFAHFANPAPQRGDVLGAEMSVQTETHFQLVDRLGCYTRSENLVQPFESVVVTLEPSHAFFHGQARLHRLFHQANSGESGQMAVGLIRVHG